MVYRVIFEREIVVAVEGLAPDQKAYRLYAEVVGRAGRKMLADLPLTPQYPLALLLQKGRVLDFRALQPGSRVEGQGRNVNAT